MHVRLSVRAGEEGIENRIFFKLVGEVRTNAERGSRLHCLLKSMIDALCTYTSRTVYSKEACTISIRNNEMRAKINGTGL